MQNPKRLARIAGLCAWLMAAPSSAAPADALGGGFVDTGIRGAYFANPDLSGEPSFTRRDVRIDFDWEELRPIGGSTAEPYRSFPRDGFSVRWSGRIIARFSEAYTFLGEADDGLRIRVRAAGESSWATVVDRWEQAGPFESEPFMLRAGELYDIQVEYREVSGAARCTLRWKSPSTPSEVIDPVRQGGLNLTRHGLPDYVWADLMKSRRYGKRAEEIDDLGWPTASGVELVAGEMYYSSTPELSGSYLLQFQGQAEVHQECCIDVVFQSGGRQFARRLPKGVGYERSTNTTTAIMAAPGSRMMLTFNDTQRGPGGRGDGVSGIRLMRPIAVGSSQHHRPDEIGYRPFKRAVEAHFTLLRFLGFPDESAGEWSQRTLPDDAFFIGETGEENWEYAIMLANETGSDLYITVPIGADDAYLEKFALLTRYGSDGREPYEEPTAAPVYPPLNPNLRIYVEIDNEIWNWAFVTTHVAQELTHAEQQRGSEVWKALDYDGEAGNPKEMKAISRWLASRTVEASKAFRRTWGDAAMGPRVRLLLEYQYDNFQDTAFSALDFIDGYYNNRRTENVSDPHPVSYYLWGAGGAAYYGLGNGAGSQTHTVFRDADFESTTLEPQTLRQKPAGNPWTFKGRAGLVRPDGKERIEGLKNLPTPETGHQAAFIIGKGSISQELRFAKPGTYAIAFNAAGSGEGWPGFLSFDVLVDKRSVSPRDQRDPRTSPHHAMIGGWNRRIDNLEEEWGSAVFRIDAPGTHEISFVGRAASSDYLLIDNVRIASADAILSSGFDKGSAIGQEGEADFAYQLRSQSKYARAFGLQVLAYESGWSVGGDFHQAPLQNWSKLHDPRATAINDQAIAFWDQSGSALMVWGVYEYWPSHDLAGSGDYAIMHSIRGASKRLRSEATYGRELPATIRIDDSDWSYAREASGWRRYIFCSGDSADQWHAWMLIAPATAVYPLQIDGSGDGRFVVEVDGEPVVELSSLDESPGTPLALELTKGAHAIRVVMVGSDLELDRIEIGAQP